MASAEISEQVINAEAQIEVIPLNGFIGAEIRGIDLRKPPDQDEFQAVHDAFVRYQVIVFRSQDITLAQQIAFAERFGPLTIHPFGPKKEGQREVILYDNDADNPPTGTDCWHSDETFRECPPMATMLHCLVAPASGGDTVFSSMTAAYRGLSERMKQYIHGLEAQHDFIPFRKFLNRPEQKEKLREIEDQFPNVWHPVVRVHPVSGQRALFVSKQFTLRIKDLDDEESDAILRFLIRQAHRPEYQLRVKWAPHSVVMWDNRSTQHYASFDYYPQRRKMERVTMAGDRPFGPKEPYTPETVIGSGEFMPMAVGTGKVKRDFEI